MKQSPNWQQEGQEDLSLWKQFRKEIGMLFNFWLIKESILLINHPRRRICCICLWRIIRKKMIRWSIIFGLYWCKKEWTIENWTQTTKDRISYAHPRPKNVSLSNPVTQSPLEPNSLPAHSPSVHSRWDSSPLALATQAIQKRNPPLLVMRPRMKFKGRPIAYFKDIYNKNKNN